MKLDPCRNIFYLRISLNNTKKDSNYISMVKLYGGAVSTEFPVSDQFKVVDISQIRQIPDTQEVFIFESCTFDNGKLDKSIIFDLLERVDGVDYDKAILAHLDDMVETKVSNFFVERIDHVINASGDAQVVDANFSFIIHENDRRDASESDSPISILTFLNLFRLENVETDVLISMNVPLMERLDGTQLAHNLLGTDPKYEQLRNDYLLFKRINLNYKILDWGLFGI